jgi:Pyruvate/2-oxoacid:ferredoxin oxidoreductase delta subunit
MNVLLFSSDPVALDAAACRMIDVNPEVVPTAKAGEKAGLGTYHMENITFLGDPLESFVNKSFIINRTPPDSTKGGRVRVFIKNRITQRPVIDKVKCTHCGTCVRMCPVEPKAVDWVKGDKTKPPKHNYDRCIRCYCCQETCPEGAISVVTPWIARLMGRM